MKTDEIPQEGNRAHPGLRKAIYAQDRASGEYQALPSLGWKMEEIVTYEALNEIASQCEEAKAAFFKGELSPLPYYMLKNKMDLFTLSQYVGMRKWRIKRHFKPKVFARLKEKTLQKYACAFEISIDEVRSIRGGDE